MVFLLFISILLLFAGVCTLGGTLTAVLASRYHSGDVNGILLLSAIGTACLALGLFLFVRIIRKLKLRRAQRAAGLIPPKKRKKLGKTGKIVLTCVGIYALLIVVGVCGRLITQSTEEKALNELIKPRLGTVYSAEGVSMPDHPKYIILDTAKGECVPRPDNFPKGDYTNRINRANILVYCQKNKEKIGYWYAYNSIVPIADAWAETYEVSIIRLDDWSLVAQQTFSKERYESRLEGYTYRIYLNEQEIGEFLDKYLD